MASLNKVFLIGNLTRDPDLRYTPNGTAVVTFGLAINRNYTTGSGEKKEETCFARIVVFGRQAENCNQFLAKGRQVFIEGRLQYRSWESDGQKRSSLDVVAERVQFLTRPRSQEEAAATKGELLQDISFGEEEIELNEPPPQKDENNEEVPF
jgi:single-strand DNA-binding protein